MKLNLIGGDFLIDDGLGIFNIIMMEDWFFLINVMCKFDFEDKSFDN